MKKQRERSLTELAQAAFRQAAKKVKEQAERTGTPIVVCVNGKTTWMNVVNGRLVPTERPKDLDDA